MQPFNTLTAVAAPLPIANIDTDMILSARFLKTVSREGLGDGLFFALRHDENDRPRPDFVLNQNPWSQANILITYENFGCGSSREHAPWALLDFGVRCIVAPSFADIFYGNCFKNGILPIILTRIQIDALMTLARNPETAKMTIDLEKQTVTADSETFAFNIDAKRRERLLRGVDDIAVALTYDDEIIDLEQRVRDTSPWLATAGLPLPK